MKEKLFSCEVHFFLSTHLNLIYDGFEKLRKLGIIDVTYKKVSGKGTKPVLKVIVDNKYTIIYDLMDGFNWIDGSKKEQLDYFANNFQADFYFKRSYDVSLQTIKHYNCKLYPLGLNYPLHAEVKHKALKHVIVSSTLFKFLKPNYDSGFPSEYFEYPPIRHDKNQIIFMARLWDPDAVASEDLKAERLQINKKRIKIIETCRKEFGSLFFGGLMEEAHTARFCKPDIILSNKTTQRANYLQAIKASNIGISSTGLHRSIGWQMGEYVAASRCIISMPLQYELPGSFSQNKNYLEFNNEDELVTKIQCLLDNKEQQLDMMTNNFHYYNNYLRPDVLVLNTLLKVYNEINNYN